MASTSVSLKQAFVIRADVLRRLGDILETKVGKLSITARCTDDVQREFRNVQALIEYDNIRSRQICRLGLDSRSDDRSKSASISFDSGPFSLVDLSITSPSDEFVVAVRQDVLALVGELRPWYGRVSTVDFTGLALLTLGVIPAASLIGLLLAVVLGFVTINITHGPTSASEIRGMALFCLAVVAAAGVIWALDRTRDRLFPAAVFAIGEGLTRYQTQDTIRWVVVVGLVVSCVGSLLASVLR